MTFTFRPAARAGVSLMVGLAGPSGSGKTYSAMRLASGIVGPQRRFAVIDTEAGRARHYAGLFAFDVADLTPPFRPERYTEAIMAAAKAGYAAIVVDSFSHEWAGEGGVLEWHEAEMQRMAGDDWARRERVKAAAWIKPKMAHKAMVQRLLQLRAHVIVCLRAEEKVDIVKGDDGKTRIVPRGWVAICGKDFPYELTVSFLMTPDRPGVPQPLKLQEQHRTIFRPDAVIDENAGARLAQWASGDTATPPAHIANSGAVPPDAPPNRGEHGGADEAPSESESPPSPAPAAVLDPEHVKTRDAILDDIDRADDLAALAAIKESVAARGKTLPATMRETIQNAYRKRAADLRAAAAAEDRRDERASATEAA